jgi:hypothetical protein
VRKALRALLLLGAMCTGLPAQPAAAAAPTEQQLKAVFLFNFTHFVTWPPGAFATPAEPFVIGILGNDDFAAQVEEAVRDERLDEHPMQVRRFRKVEDIQDCRILFIDRARGSDLGRALALLAGRNTLTVSDLDGAAQRGATIELVNENNRIRLVINTEAARDAGLTVSSKMLRLARPAGTGN